MGRRESIQLLFQNGLQHYNQGDMKRCLACCDAILHSDNSHHEAWNLAGLAFYAAGDAQKSLEMLNRAYNLSNREDYLVNIAEILRRVGKTREALQIMLGIKDPTIAHYHYNLAKIYADMGDVENAKQCYETLLAQNPDDKETLFSLGNLFSKTDRALAQKYYEKSYQLGLLDAGINLASLLSKDERLSESLELYQQIAKHTRNPSFFFNYANTLSKITYTDKESFKICKQYYKKALELEESPVFAMNYSQLLLRFGEIKEGFKLAELRLHCDIVPPTLQPFYYKPNSKLLGKRLLVYHEQGFGDTLVFARFLPQIASKVKELIVVVQPQLLRLFEQGFLGISELENSSLQDSLPQSGFDFALALPSLPFALKIATQNALVAPLKPKELPKRKHKKFKIGLCAASSSANPLHAMRDIALDSLVQALDFDGVELYSLQYAPSEADKVTLQAHKIKDIGSKIGDFADTQNELQKLDVLVSVDTAIVHLAASLGLKVCVLLHKYYDWRYAVVEGENLLYAHNLYRFVQESLGDWNPPLAQLRQQIKDWLHE